MRVKKTPKDGLHVLTVRLRPQEWEHLQAVQAAQSKKSRRRVSFNDIVVQSVLDLPPR